MAEQKIAFGNVDYKVVAIRGGVSAVVNGFTCFGFGLIGGIVGGTAANYFANQMFGKNLTADEMMNQGISGEAPLWLIRFFQWLA